MFYSATKSIVIVEKHLYLQGVHRVTKDQNECGCMFSHSSFVAGNETKVSLLQIEAKKDFA